MTFSQAAKIVYASPAAQAAICHDYLREHMAAGVPKPMRPRCRGRARPSEIAKQRMAEAKRKAGDDTFRKLAPEVGRRFAAGESRAAIAREIGWSETTVARTIRRIQREATQ